MATNLLNSPAHKNHNSDSESSDDDSDNMSLSSPDTDINHISDPDGEMTGNDSESDVDDVFFSSEPDYLTVLQHETATYLVIKYHHILLVYAAHVMPHERVPRKHKIPVCDDWPMSKFFGVFRNYTRFIQARMEDAEFQSEPWKRLKLLYQEAHTAMMMTNSSIAFLIRTVALLDHRTALENEIRRCRKGSGFVFDKEEFGRLFRD